MSVSIDYKDLIGVPFKYGGRGPDYFDCYGLLGEMVWRNQGLRIPEVTSPEILEEIAAAVDGQRSRWKLTAKKTGRDPIPFSDMKVGHALELRIRGLACHVGFIHRPRKFLHTWEDSGGVVENDIEIWRSRILSVYEYVG